MAGQLMLIDFGHLSDSTTVAVDLLILAALVIAGVTFLLFIVWEGPRLRRRLFEANGYTAEDAPIRLTLAADARQPGPSERYGNFSLLGVLLFYGLSLALDFVSTWCATLIAVVKIWLREAL
jgi:hypothetical protein